MEPDLTDKDPVAGVPDPVVARALAARAVKAQALAGARALAAALAEAAGEAGGEALAGARGPAPRAASWSPKGPAWGDYR